MPAEKDKYGSDNALPTRWDAWALTFPPSWSLHRINNSLCQSTCHNITATSHHTLHCQFNMHQVNISCSNDNIARVHVFYAKCREDNSTRWYFHKGGMFRTGWVQNTAGSFQWLSRTFFATLSAIVSRDPHVTGDLAEYNCFTRVCESAVCCKIFIKCILGVTGLYISYSQWHSSNQKSLSVVYKEYVLMTLISNVR